MSDNYQYYRKYRNKIAKKNKLTAIMAETAPWQAVHKTISTSLRDDSGGLKLLDKFEKAAPKFRNGCYSDDGETIGLWHVNKTELQALAKATDEKDRASIGSRALFHPGYLPIRRIRDDVGWISIRVENPNPTPYIEARPGIEWLWNINIKANLDVSKLKSYQFFVGKKYPQGGRWGIHACVRIDRTYGLPHPTVTTQKQLDRVIADANLYVEKLKQVYKNYKEAGFTSVDGGSMKRNVINKLWNLSKKKLTK